MTPSPFDPPADELKWVGFAEELSAVFAAQAPTVDLSWDAPGQR